MPVILKLGEKYDLTVAHYADEKLDDSNINFKQILLTAKPFSGLKFFKENIYKISNNYDVVISLGEIRVIPNMLLGFRKRKFGLIFWGIGVSASYDKKFDSDSKLDKARFWLMKQADALLFYSDYPVTKYTKMGFNKEKLFVAHNTVLVEEKIEIPKNKKHFIFVGTLYKQKKIYDLLFAYKKYSDKTLNSLPLIIIGGGDEKEKVEKWIKENNFTNKIYLKGQINDQSILRDYYRDSVACISPGQAGLTVLNSLAYGVPFVTYRDAITGGEILNVVDNKTGVLYDGSIDDLAEIMQKLAEDENYTFELSKNAQNFYFESRTIDNMVKGFEQAITYVYKLKNRNGN